MRLAAKILLLLELVNLFLCGLNAGSWSACGNNGLAVLWTAGAVAWLLKILFREVRP